MMMDEVRRYMEVVQGMLGRLTPAQARDLAKGLAGGQGKEQVTKTAHELLEWSHRNRERMTDLVGREVRSQLATVGVATRDDIDALKKRVRHLEREIGGTTTTRKRSTAKRSTAKRSTAKAAAASQPATGQPPAGTTPTT